MERVIQQEIILPREIVRYSTVASSEKSRPGLTGVYLNLERMRAEVTDGFMFWSLAMNDENEFDVAVKPEDIVGDAGRGVMFQTEDIRRLGQVMRKRVVHRIRVQWLDYGQGRADGRYVIVADVVNMQNMTVVEDASPVVLYDSDEPYGRGNNTPTWPDVRQIYDNAGKGFVYDNDENRVEVENEVVYRIGLGYEVLEKVAMAMRASGVHGAVFEFRGTKGLVQIRPTGAKNSDRFFAGAMPLALTEDLEVE